MEVKITCGWVARKEAHRASFMGKFIIHLETLYALFLVDSSFFIEVVN
jgi:hypothetical protein